MTGFVMLEMFSFINFNLNYVVRNSQADFWSDNFEQWYCRLSVILQINNFVDF